MSKVFVLTESKLFKEETYVAVKSTLKKAEDHFRKKYPHMTKNSNNEYYSQKEDKSTYPDFRLLFIREEELD